MGRRRRIDQRNAIATGQMASDQDRGRLLRTILIIAFPPLRLVYTIFDVICYLFQQLCRSIGLLIKLVYRIIETFIKGICKSLEKLGFVGGGAARNYQKLGGTKDRQQQQQQQQHVEPLPYENEFCRRFLTHTGGLLLGLGLYWFVYIVLVKHHSVHSISVAFLLMLPYLLILENSHSIRAIMMLCLPIMFTNRGRALVFCCMLAIMVAGPLKNSQNNINELHKSLNCSKQYLILRTDDYVEQNVVKRLMRVEQVIETLVEDIQQFAVELRRRVQIIVELAYTVDKYIRLAIEELKKIVDICNEHSQEFIDNCKRTVGRSYHDCKDTMGALGSILCELIRPAGRTYCDSVNWPAKFCAISKGVILYVENRLEERLAIIMQSLENMLYVKVEINHEYYYKGKKSKSFKKALSEIRFDVEHKFWYIHFVVRVFNLVTLILVVWITLTATLYHMHYMDDIGYDNMYLDARLVAIDEHRKRRARRIQQRNQEQDQEQEDQEQQQEEPEQEEPPTAGSKLIGHRTSWEHYSIFPMSNRHQQHYLRPFDIWMNEMERHKLLIAGLVWLIIVCYIAFFVALDFGLYHLIELINEILNDVLFRSDLPLIDVSSKMGNASLVVHYNRTYLSQLRDRGRAMRAQRQLHANSTLVSGLYRRLMDSVERNIPDDVMILDSLRECLPNSSRPNFKIYKNLAYLAALTFGGVILEAYALRLRHWIANLYYPRRANKRSVWLYRKILAEKPKYEHNGRAPELLAAEMLGRAIKN